MFDVACMTGGVNVPSSRFRVRQYIPSLLEYGVNLVEFKTITTAYPPSNKWLRPVWGGGRLLEITAAVVKSRRCDITLIQREMISTIATLERFTPRPRILDVDDAIHLHRNGKAAEYLAKNSDRIICGNNYLAEIYAKWNDDVVVLPTAVDTDNYKPVDSESAFREGCDVVLGWIGTSGNFPYLLSVESALQRVFEKFPNVRLHVVSDTPPNFTKISSKNYIFTKWSDLEEIKNIQSFDIGLMPLIDSAWARGKCSFKMLQYMACGIPVVVSPVGMNVDVLRLGEIGFGPNILSEWVDSLISLIENPALRRQQGVAGRAVTVEKFSLLKLAPKFASYLG